MVVVRWCWVGNDFELISLLPPPLLLLLLLCNLGLIIHMDLHMDLMSLRYRFQMGLKNLMTCMDMMNFLSMLLGFKRR